VSRSLQEKKELLNWILGVAFGVTLGLGVGLLF
jgi:hypothetical protein